MVVARRRFNMGRVVATPGAIRELDEHEIAPISLLTRHVHGDWGELDDEDRKTNDDAVLNGERILSNYKLGKSNTYVWIITERDRSVTTLLLPEEY